MPKRTGPRRRVSDDAVKRFAAKSTEASARLERRGVPEGYVRSTKVEQFLAKRHSQTR